MRTAAGALAIALTLSVSPRAQAPAEQPMPGSKMTRDQVIERLSGTDRGTTASAARGSEVYHELCAACHVLGETGESVGPDLTTLAGRFGHRDVLEAILYPSRTISDQYAVTVFELDDGSYVSGVVLRNTAWGVSLSTTPLT